MADKKVHVSDTGRAAAVQVGATEREVAAALTGEDTLPGKGMELGRPPGKPEFDPHAERNAIASAIDDEDDNETGLIASMVFVGPDDGHFEEHLKAVIAYAEGRGFINIQASMGAVDPDLYDCIVDLNG